jgi:hypothetical protein
MGRHPVEEAVARSELLCEAPVPGVSNGICAGCEAGMFALLSAPPKATRKGPQLGRRRRARTFDAWARRAATLARVDAAVARLDGRPDSRR